MIYADHAATSYPKPPVVLEAMAKYLETSGNPGRSGHRLAKAGEGMLWEGRRAVADLIGATDPDRIIFNLNATMALNVAIQGLVRPGERVLTSSFEHNSVVRPLHALQQEGVLWTVLRPGPDEPMDLEHLEAELRRGGVRLVVVGHASNVTGAVQPLDTIVRLTHEYGALLLVDAAQTLGHRPVRVEDADVLVFAGHKGLLGPQGTGGMHVSAAAAIRPLLYGGTGSRSESPEQPHWLPDSLEAGTPNGVGIAGLAAAVRYVARQDLSAIEARELRLRQRFVDGVRDLPDVIIHDWPSTAPPAAVVSLTVRGLLSTDAATLLEERHGVLTRGGLHCAFLSHRTLGSPADGTVRFSFASFTTDAEIDGSVNAIRDVARARRLAPAGSRAKP